MGGQAEAEHQQAASRAQGLSVPSARQDDRPAEPGVGDRHTYIAMRQGFLYLVAIIDWATRRVLSWRLSNTLTTRFCVEALSEALDVVLATPAPVRTPDEGYLGQSTAATALAA